MNQINTVREYLYAHKKASNRGFEISVGINHFGLSKDEISVTVSHGQFKTIKNLSKYLDGFKAEPSGGAFRINEQGGVEIISEVYDND